MLPKPKLFRITTAPVSMSIILRGQLNYMSQHYEVIGLTKQDDKHYPTVQSREGIRMIPLNLERTISPLKDVIALFKLIQILRKERPDIVHTHTPKAGLIGMLASWFTRVPIRIHTIGGMPLMELKGLKYKIVYLTEKITYACAHQVWPNSNGLKDWMLDQNLLRPSKLKVIAYGASNGVNTSLFDPLHKDLIGRRDQLRNQFRIKENDLVFCFVGRIAKEKGMLELLTAFQNLKRIHTHLHIVLVGLFEKSHGGLSEKEEILINKEQGIHFLGRFDDVRPYYAMSDVFVLPSYREGFPNALMEAGAMGLPSIATKINGCNEIINENQNGLLIPIKDVKSLQNAMQLLIENPLLRKEMSFKSRSQIVEKYDNSILWTAMKEEYNKLRCAK